MPLANYGQTSPAGLDPWPIESTLAPLAVQGNPSAQRMLGDYQYQRDAANNLYGIDMQQQHEFAKQQLQQQLYEANLKGLAEAKDPTVLQIMANAPGYASVFGGAGAPAISDALARAQQGAAAKNYEAAGKGTEGFSNAGYMVDARGIPGMPPGVPVTQSENVRLAAERLRANATLGAAALRANADKDMTTISTQVPGTGAGDFHTMSRKVHTRDVTKALAEADAINQDVRDRRAGVTPLQPNPATTTTTTTGGGQQTSASAAPARLDTNSPAGLKAQQDAIRYADKLAKLAPTNPAAKAALADLQAPGAMDGTVYRTYKSPTGKTIVQGKTQAHIID